MPGNKYKNILITGGSGGVSQVLSEQLRQHYHVVLFDKVPPATSRFPWKSDLPFIGGDLTNFGDCVRAIDYAQAEVVVHLGAIPGPRELHPLGSRQEANPEDSTMHINVMGTYSLLDACRRLGVKKVVFASTYFVLGMGNRINKAEPFMVDYLPIDEAHPCSPQDSYSLSKLMNEEMLAACTRAYGIRTVALRFAWVHYTFGTYKYGNVPAGEPQRGSPEDAVFTYLDARDIPPAVELAIEKEEGLDPHEVFYLTTDTLIGESVKSALNRLYPDCSDLASKMSDDDPYISIEKARTKLGYEPQYSWRQNE